MPIAINALVADARRRFRAAGISQEEAALDARLLAQHALGWTQARLLTHGDEPASDTFRTEFETLVRRRATREPLAYITGVREFWNIDIEVTPAVLIPRPETELLIEAALEHFEHDQPLRIVDVCTGSGCVVIGLGREFPRASLVAADISASALAVARRNISRYELDSRVLCVKTDLLEGLPAPFDLIVANPPYVPLADSPELAPEVRQFEPPRALFGGADGMQIVTRLIAQAPAALRKGGLLIFEFGQGQLGAVERAVSRTPLLTLLDVKHDLQDIPRTAVVRRN
jgi:release factor glutamine methyltransferase